MVCKCNLDYILVVDLVDTLFAVPPLFGGGGGGGAALVEEVSRRLAAAAGRTRFEQGDAAGGRGVARLHLNNKHNGVTTTAARLTARYHGNRL